MKRRPWLLIGGLLVYVLLLVILVQAETGFDRAAAENGGAIDSVWRALWFSLTTLTTVGYGDLVPHSPLGKCVGAVFMLCSLGLLVLLIHTVVTRLRSRILPRLYLGAHRRRPWYVLDGRTAVAEALARNLRREEPDCLTLFVGADAAASAPGEPAPEFSVEELLRIRRKRDGLTVFCLAGDGAENYRRAAELARQGVDACCLTEYEPELLPAHLSVFCPDRCRARLYWREHPLRSPSERIVLIGGGRAAHALLEQALLVNVIATDQHVVYAVYGGAGDFAASHLCLDDRFSVGAEDPARDSLLFRGTPGAEDLELLRRADRVIVCEDSVQETAERLFRLRRLMPVRGEIHACLEGALDGVTVFGSAEEIFTPELVLHQALNRTAQAMHERYRERAGADVPRWEALGGFLRRSNLAAADHLEMKERILLGAEAEGLRADERRRAAWAAWQALSDARREELRAVEHERWLRFHSLNNWRYAPERDNAGRLHPLLVPFADLDRTEQEKDDDAWKLLGALANEKIGGRT